MLSSELREVVQSFVDEHMNVRELENWIVPRLPVFLCESDSTDAEVVAAVELGLAELSQRIRTLAELRAMLNELLRQEKTVVFRTGSTTTSTSSEQIRAMFLAPQLPPMPTQVTWVPL
jgi:hypothetical protein